MILSKWFLWLTWLSILNLFQTVHLSSSQEPSQCLFNVSMTISQHGTKPMKKWTLVWFKACQNNSIPSISLHNGSLNFNTRTWGVQMACYVFPPQSIAADCWPSCQVCRLSSSSNSPLRVPSSVTWPLHTALLWSLGSNKTVSRLKVFLLHACILVLTLTQYYSAIFGRKYSFQA